MKHPLKPLLAAGLAAASVYLSHAQPFYLAGDYNGWSPNANQMTGGPVVYDFTITNQAPGTYGQVKVTDGTWNNAWPSQNLKVLYDSTGSATVHFYPGSSTDGWLPLANRVGFNDTDNSAGWGLAGDFNGWDGTQAILASQGAGIYSNSIVISSNATYGFKFQSPAGSWNDIYFGSDFGNGGANGSYTLTNAPQTVPVVLDLPHGRYLVGGLAPSAVTNDVVFAVDMTYQIQLGLFHPGSSVFVAGDFNGWPGIGSGGLALTNFPPYNGGSNTNIYYGTNTFVGLPNEAAASYKFTQNDPNAQNSGWETSNNRSLTLLSTNGLLMLSVVSFSDLSPSAALSAPTPVSFSVDMTGAVGTDSHVFDPNSDDVYINGEFVSWYAWAGGINPAPAPAGFQMIRQGSTLIYTNTIIIPAGTAVNFQYKYGMDPGRVNSGPLDDEAGIGQNHYRVVRSTALNPYPMPTDTFGNQYHEPFFDSGDTTGANLTVGAVSGGAVPIQWLGRPGARLAWSTNVNGGAWQQVVETDGTNWTAGYNSTNGFVSQTNWPASSGSLFFRVVKPN